LLRPTSRVTLFAASSERDEVTPFPCHDDDGICRWLAYSGSPVLVEELLYNRQNSLIVQSLHSRLGAEETNGDGFGLGWYGDQETPGVFRSIEPAWNDRNLRELSGQIISPLVFAHIRASTGSPVQQTNCHPFRHGRWLFMHNGFIDGLREIKRDLALAIDPSLYPEIEGTTDTELMFFLALTFGLEDDPPQAVARTVGLVESVGREHGVEFPFQGTIATTDGECIWAFRYSSKGDSRSLFFSTDLPTLRELYPEDEQLRGLDDESRLVVSEPLGDLPGVWNEVPESSYGVIQPGQDELHPFEPAVPSRA
jgi:predicted glutamine amidotransferase